MNWTEFVGYVAGFLLTVGMIPQVWRLFKLKSAKEISMLFCVSFTAGTGMWLVYGLLFKLPAVIFWNTLGLVLASVMVYAKARWGRD